VIEHSKLRAQCACVNYLSRIVMYQTSQWNWNPFFLRLDVGTWPL